MTAATAHASAALTPALELCGLTVVLGGQVVVEDVTLQFLAGRTYAVVGRSGAGKSVMLKAAAGLLPIARGSVRVHASPLVFVHQDPALIDTLNVEENVAFAVERVGLSRREADARVEEALAQLGLLPIRHHPPSLLPVAQQKRVALARALCLRPRLLILDEPTTGLDPRAAQAVDDAIAEAPTAHGLTLVVVTHSQRTLHRLAPEIVVVEQGRARLGTRRAA